ncbi:MAG TPA: hypothetical protein VK459_25795, partial [Polyangiaceae bacterium]|nr:hypothetical protein [Polyangiaceae bacterium]
LRSFAATIASAVSVALIVACNTPTDVDTPAAPCLDAAKDCPAPANACQIAVCEAQTCAVQDVTSGTGACVTCASDSECAKPATCSSDNVCVCSKPCPAWNKAFINGLGSGLATNADGSVVMVGGITHSVDLGGGPLSEQFAIDAFAAKYDAEGKHLWSQSFGMGGNNDAYTVAADSAANVILGGKFSEAINFGAETLTSAGLYDAFIAKFDPSGKHLWSKRFGDSTHEDVLTTTADKDGNIVLSGTFRGMVNFGGADMFANCGAQGDLYVVKLDPQGNHLWSKSFCTSGVVKSRGAGIDGQGNIFLAGELDGAVDFGGGELAADIGDAFVVKFAPSGDHLWSSKFGTSSAQGAQGASGIVVDKNGDAFVLGYFGGGLDLGGITLTASEGVDVVVVKLKGADGKPVWAKGFGKDNNQFSQSLAIDSGGNVVVSVQFEGSIDFGGGTFSTPTGGGTVNHGAIAKLSGVDGSHIYSKHLEGFNVGGLVVASDPSDNTFVTGGFGGPVDFGLGPIMTSDPSGGGFFLVKFQP